MQTISKKITSMLLNLILIVGLISVPVVFTTGCGDDDNNTTQTQTREIHGYLGTIPVWQEVGVSDEDMNKIWGWLEGVKAGQYWIDEGIQTKLEAKITEIQVHPGNDLVKDGSILKIGSENKRVDILDYMEDIAEGRKP